MAAFCLQPWTTVDGDGVNGVRSITQNETDWLDLDGSADAVFWIDVPNVTSPTAPVSLNLESAPTKDEASFQPILAAISLAASATPVVAKTVQTPSTPQLSKWLRWRLSVPAAFDQTWGATLRIRGKASRQAFFVPTQLTGCQLWLRADLGVTSSGGLINNWADQSGNGNSASKGSTAPNYVTSAMNGFPAIQGTGTQYMTTTSFAMGSSATILTAVQASARPEQGYARIVEADNATSYYLGCDTNGTKYQFIVDNNVSPFGNLVGGSVDSTGVNAIITGVFAAGASTTGTGSLYVNGTSVIPAGVTFNNPSPPSLPLYLMRKDSASASFWQGYLAEVIVYGRALTTQELALVHRYLGARYAVTVP